MRAEAYSIHMNCSYSHGLDDTALESTLSKLIRQELLTCKVGRIWMAEKRKCVDGKIYTLTDAGGRLWELERCPDWHRYVISSQRLLGNSSRGMIRVACVSEMVGRLCLGAMFASNLITPISRIKVRYIWNTRLQPWKTFERAAILRCQTNDHVNDTKAAVLWDVYQSKRCWWRTIAELDTLDRAC